ncbi:hypothetical protein DMUE_4629 [Dictyocoela muelleri]|nr:hypothetical protein DMUE_4629 [Dictyocoela muelleri]
MKPDEIENMLIRFERKDFIDYLMEKRYIKKEMICEGCNVFIELKTSNEFKYGYVWRCMFSGCQKYKGRKSIRKGSFFETLKISFLHIFKILIRLATDVPQHSIEKGLGG